MKVTILGCGGSQGVPSSTGDWGLCDKANPLNYRRRPAILIETATPSGARRTILIDSPPELREQLMRARVKQIDAVLYTHTHADHLHGIDDLRPFSRVLGRPIPTYATPAVVSALEERFAYAVLRASSGYYPPILNLNQIENVTDIAGISVTSFPQDHGFGLSTGFRIGKLGYSIDVVRLNEAAFAALDGITHWIVDCQQLEPHPSHSHLSQTLDWIRRIRPERAVLTHLGPKLDYAALTAMLPLGVEAGFDGMTLDL